MKITENELRSRLRTLIRESGKSSNQWAIAHGIYYPRISEFLNGRRHCPPALCHLLGVRRIVMYEEVER